MALSFAELARCLSSSVASQLKIFARAGVTRSCQRPGRYLTPPTLMRNLMFLSRGDRCLGRQQTVQRIDKYVLNVPNTFSFQNLHKNRMKATQVGSKSGSCIRYPPTELKTPRSRKALTRASSIMDDAPQNVGAEKPNIRHKKIKSPPAADGDCDFQLQNAYQKEKKVAGSATGERWNGKSGAPKTSQARESKTKHVVNQNLVERCVETGVTDAKPASRGQGKKTMSPKSEDSLRESNPQQSLIAPVSNLAKEMGDWLKAVREHLAKMEQEDMLQKTSTDGNRRVYRSSERKFRLPKSSRKGVAPQPTSSLLETGKIVNFTSHRVKGSKKTSKTEKNSQNVKNCSGKDFGTVKNIEKINNEITRLRRERNVEKDSVRPQREKPSILPNQPEELLEIRPTYVENVTPDFGRGSGKKAASEESFNSRSNVQEPQTMPKMLVKELEQSKSSSRSGKGDDQTTYEGKRISALDTEFTAPSQENGFILVDTNSCETAAVSSTLAENVTRNATCSPNVQTPQKIHFSSVSGGTGENKSFVLADETSSNRSVRSYQDLGSTKLGNENGFILVGADGGLAGVSRAGTAEQQLDVAQPTENAESIQRISKQERKNFVLVNDNPHLSLRTAVRNYDGSNPQSITSDRNKPLSPEGLGKFPAMDTGISSSASVARNEKSIHKKPPISTGALNSQEVAQRPTSLREEGEKRFSLFATAGEKSNMQNDLPSRDELQKWPRMLEKKLGELRSNKIAATNDTPQGDSKTKTLKEHGQCYQCKVKGAKSALDVRDQVSRNVTKTVRGLSAEARKQTKKIANQSVQIGDLDAEEVMQRPSKPLVSKAGPKSGDFVALSETSKSQNLDMAPCDKSQNLDMAPCDKSQKVHAALCDKSQNLHMASCDKSQNLHMASCDRSQNNIGSKIYVFKPTRFPRAEVYELTPEVGKRKKDLNAPVFPACITKPSTEPQLCVKPEEVSKKLKQGITHDSDGYFHESKMLATDTASDEQASHETVIRTIQPSSQSLIPGTEETNLLPKSARQNFQTISPVDVKKDSGKSKQSPAKSGRTASGEETGKSSSSNTRKSALNASQKRQSNEKGARLRGAQAAAPLSGTLSKPRCHVRKQTSAATVKVASSRKNDNVIRELREQWSKDFNKKLKKYKKKFYSSNFQKNANCSSGASDDSEAPCNEVLLQPTNNANTGLPLVSSSPQTPNKLVRKSEHLPTMGMAERLLAAARKPPGRPERSNIPYEPINSDSSMNTYTDATITPWTSEIEEFQDVDQFEEWVQNDMPEIYKGKDYKNPPNPSEKFDTVPKQMATEGTKLTSEDRSSSVDGGSNIDGPNFARIRDNESKLTDRSHVTDDATSSFLLPATKMSDDVHSVYKDISGVFLGGASKADESCSENSQISLSNATETTVEADHSSDVDTLTHSGYQKYPWDVGSMSIFDSVMGPLKQESSKSRRFDDKVSTSKLSSTNSPKVSKLLGSLDGVASLTVIPESPEPSEKILKPTLKRSKSRERGEEKRVSFKALATASEEKMKENEARKLGKDAADARQKFPFTRSNSDDDMLRDKNPRGSDLRQELAEQRSRDEREARIKLIKAHTKQIREYESVLSKYRDQLGKF